MLIQIHVEIHVHVHIHVSTVHVHIITIIVSISFSVIQQANRQERKRAALLFSRVQSVPEAQIYDPSSLTTVS
jgi:hypothetical protein